jgi:hypothetical protein
MIDDQPIIKSMKCTCCGEECWAVMDSDDTGAKWNESSCCGDEIEIVYGGTL